MNNREQFEAEVPKEVKSGNFTEVFYTNNEYEAAYDGWQACVESKQAELNKANAEMEEILADTQTLANDLHKTEVALNSANARIAQLEECLEEIRKLGGFHKAKVMAVAALTESPTTWLSEHDKAVERKDKTT